MWWLKCENSIQWVKTGAEVKAFFRSLKAERHWVTLHKAKFLNFLF